MFKFQNPTRKFWLTLGVSAFALGAAGTAHAQAEDEPEVPETQAQDTPDGLMFDAIIVTGSATGQSKFETSYAISNFDTDTIQRLAPLNTADLLGQVPGVFAEASGGEASNVYKVRGIPDPGSFQSFQEDGIPLFPENQGVFFTGDGIVRTDLMTESFEFVRGGSAPIYATNAASLYNQITRQGGDTPEGAAQLTLGDTGLYRVDGYWSGPISENTYIAAGGFYRYHDGYRDNGFPSDEGGQFRVNLRHEIGNGEVRAHVKYFNDSNVFYLPIPLADPRDPSVSLDKYIDFFEGTLNSSALENAVFKYPSLEGPVTEERDLSDGRQTEYINLGFDVEQEIFGFQIENKLRYTDGNIDFDAIYSSANPEDGDDFAAARFDAAQAAFGGTTPVDRLVYQIAETGEAYDPNAYSGLVVEGQYRNIQNDFDALMNDFRITRDVDVFGTHQLTAGVYAANFSTDLQWRNQDYLFEVAGNPRPLDLVALAADGTELGSVTDNGVLRYSSTLLSGVSEIDLYELYFADTWQVTEDLSLEIGVRQTEYEGEGFFRAPAPLPIPLSGTLADAGAQGFAGVNLDRSFEYDHTAWTVGGNYEFSDELAIYARATQSYRGPGEFNLILPFEPSVTEARQYEVGVKYDTDALSVFATAFLTKFEPFNATLFELNPETGELGFIQFVGTAESPGVEVDFSWRPLSNFTLEGAVTYNDAKVGDFVSPTGAEAPSADGNLPIRQPKLYGNLRPTYNFQIGDWDMDAYLRFNFVGERFVDLENNTELPAYETLAAGVTAYHGPWSVQLVGENLTNAEGITEGNPRNDQFSGQGSAETIYGRPIFGRNFRLVLTRSF